MSLNVVKAKAAAVWQATTT